MARILAAPALFELGNLATTLLILRATGLLRAEGHSATAATSIAVLLYAGHNACAAVAAPLAGAWADLIGPRIVLGTGAGVYVVGYLLFARSGHGVWALALAFVLAGIGIGCAETAESTTVALALPDRLRGNGFGVLGLVQSAGDLGATVVAGLLWSLVSPLAAFSYAAGWMALAVVATLTIRPVTVRVEEPS
jgi:MFS family permease